MTPPEEITENIFHMTRRERKAKNIDSLPGSLYEAVEEFEKDDIIKNALGNHIVDQYIAGKEKEWDEYITRVSSWEVEKYIVTF
ncbi:glutamine synthetase [Clostridiales bacterium]|nr:glutamine synthetase [Clostridiales bacterium]